MDVGVRALSVNSDLLPFASHTCRIRQHIIRLLAKCALPNQPKDKTTPENDDKPCKPLRRRSTRVTPSPSVAWPTPNHQSPLGSSLSPSCPCAAAVVTAAASSQPSALSHPGPFVHHHRDKSALLSRAATAAQARTRVQRGGQFFNAHERNAHANARQAGNGGRGRSGSKEPRSFFGGQNTRGGKNTSDTTSCCLLCLPLLPESAAVADLFCVVGGTGAHMASLVCASAENALFGMKGRLGVQNRGEQILRFWLFYGLPKNQICHPHDGWSANAHTCTFTT